MFTKGKWQVGYNDGSGRFGKHKGAYSSSVTCANHLLATVWHHDEDDYPKDHPIMIAKANAHLIAAAPDLYEALKHLVEYIDKEGPAAKEWRAITEWCEKGEQAILKAEGKS